MSTFKGKIGIGVVALVVLLTTLIYVATIPPWANNVEEKARLDVRQAAALVERVQRLHAYDLVALAQRAALRSAFVKSFQATDESSLREAVFAAIGKFDDELKQEKRKAHFFAVVDADGTVIARDLNIEDMHGDKLPYPSVARALRGRATSDVWFMKNRMMRGAAAPIYAEGRIRGAIVLGYDFSVTEARDEAQLFRADVVYFMDNAIRASSFQRGSSEDSGKVKDVGRAILAKEGPLASGLAQGRSTDIFPLKALGQTHLAIGGPLPDAVTILGLQMTTKVGKDGSRKERVAGTSSHQVGYAVVVNLDDRMSRVKSARYIVLILGIAMLVLMWGVMWAVARHFVTAEDSLELGVNEVINGNLDYTFDTLQEFEGLANALNVMLARLLGRPEPGSEDDPEAAWRADVIPVGDLRDPASAGIDGGQLAAEPEESYLSSLYTAYIAARKKAGMPVDGLTPQSFAQKVKANEAMLKARHKCGAVRFVLRSDGGSVQLDPIRLD